MKTTCAVDVHKDNLEVELIEWDKNDQAVNTIQKTLKGDTIWNELKGMIETIDITFVDAGYRTEEVYRFARDCGDSVYPVKGVNPIKGDGKFKTGCNSMGEMIVFVSMPESNMEEYGDCRAYNIAALNFSNSRSVPK